MSRPAPLASAALAQSAMELRLTLRRGENLLALAGIPVAVLLFFASTSLLTIPDGRPVDFLVPGSLTLAVIAAGLVNLGIATAYERSYGVLKRLGGSPLGRTGLVVAKVAAIALIVTAQVALLLGVATVVLDWRPGPTASVPLTVGTLALGTVTFAGLGLLLAGTLRAEATLAVANGLFIATMLLGGVIVPTSHLPPVLGAVADVLPAAALSASLRIGLGSTTGDATGALTVLAAWAIVAVVATIRWFRWE